MRLKWVCASDQKIMPYVKFFFTLFLRVDDIRHFSEFGDIEKYVENTGIAPPNQLVCNGKPVVGVLICYGLLLFTDRKSVV